LYYERNAYAIVVYNNKSAVLTTVVGKPGFHVLTTVVGKTGFHVLTTVDGKPGFHVLTTVDGKQGFHVNCFLVEGKKCLKIALNQMTDS
jgi:hypothetical protein